MTEIVVDASFAAAWCFKDEATPDTQQVFEHIQLYGMVVPSLWYLEMGNLLRTAERRERISKEDTAKHLSLFGLLVVKTDATTPAIVWGSILDLARQFSLTTYDATYLELATRLKLPLASRDKLLIATAKKNGNEIITA